MLSPKTSPVGDERLNMSVQFLHVSLSRTVWLSLLCLALVAIVIDAKGQRRGGRDEPPPPPPPVGTGGRKIPRPKPTPVKHAALIVNAPLGCRIWLNDSEVELQNSIRPISLNGQKVMTTYTTETGTITIKGLKPGPYKLIARKENHREFNIDLWLAVESENVVTIFLALSKGRLTVRPSVDGASVEVFKVEGDISLGRYSDNLVNAEIAPGSYRVSISKDGYRTAVREITVSPGESVFLEPVIEMLPKPQVTLKSRPAAPVLPATFTIDTDGKNAIFRVSGSTGEVSTRVGTIAVQFGGPNHGVVGSFNGMPCQVEFVKLENVAEGAVVEAPGPSNNWATVVVRVRPKDKKRPLSFAINWRSLLPASASL
jgi:hypothetical protein